jgi:hypothetical protein
VHIKKARNRLPVQQHMTESIMQRLPNLRRKQARSVWKSVGNMVQQRDGGYAASQMPKQQFIVVAVSGRILNEEQVREGWYLPPAELEAARRLLSGPRWAQPSFEETMKAAADACSLTRPTTAAALASAVAREHGADGLASTASRGTVSRMSARSHHSVLGRFETAGLPLPSRSRPASAQAPVPDIKNDASISAVAEVANAIITAAWREPSVMEALLHLKPSHQPTFAELRTSALDGTHAARGVTGPPLSPRSTAPNSPAAGSPAAAPRGEMSFTPVPSAMHFIGAQPSRTEPSRSPSRSPSRFTAPRGELSVGWGAEPSSHSVVTPQRPMNTAGTMGRGTPAPFSLPASMPASQQSQRSGVFVPPPRAEELLAGAPDIFSVLHMPAFQAFAEYVLDNALIGVLQEAVAGEAPLHAYE